jgi:hypothetical protein
MPESTEQSTAMTPEQGKAWVAAWKRAGPLLEAIRREELRAVDNAKAMHLLCFNADYSAGPRRARQHSGLVEMQRVLSRARR